MSGTLKMEVKGADQWALVLRRLQQETRRNAIDAVTYAGVKIAVSGRKMASPGAKRRKVERNTDFRRMVRERRKWAKHFGGDAGAAGSSKLLGTARIFPHFILAYRQGSRDPYKMGTFTPQTDPRRDVEMYGLARKMWNILWGQLASLKGQGNVSMEGGNGTAVVKRSIRANATRYSVSLDLSVRLNYLEKAYPGIGQAAIAKGQSALLHELDNRMERTIARYR
jgi:hypothetical protein